MALNRDKILFILEKVNKSLKQQNLHIECIMIGGAAGVFHSDKMRPTLDIDIILQQYSTNEAIMEIFSEAFIEPVTIMSVPDPDEMEFKETIHLSNIIVHIPDIYSYAITKLFTDRQKDEDDLKAFILPNIPDFQKLENLIEENKLDYVGNLNNPDLNANNISRYKEELKLK